MSVETALYPPQLNTSWPKADDMVSEGDNHITLIKTVLKTTFPNVAGAISATDVQINYLVGVTASIQGQIDSKGAKAGQTWTGTHDFSGAAAITVPTLAQGASTTGAASTAFVQNEWATRLPNYTGPITASTTELNLMVGVTSGVQTQINAKAAKAGDTYTGTHDFSGAASVKAPTMTAGDASTNVATTAFVSATAFSSALPGQAGNAGRVLTTNGTSASWTNTLTTALNVPAGASGQNATPANEVATLARGSRPDVFSTSANNGAAFAVWTQYRLNADAAYARPLPATANNGESIVLLNYLNTWGNGNFTLNIPSGQTIYLPGETALVGPNTLVFDSNRVERFDITCIGQASGSPLWSIAIS